VPSKRAQSKPAPSRLATRNCRISGETRSKPSSSAEWQGRQAQQRSSSS
jgi:hypothetical protein